MGRAAIGVRLGRPICYEWGGRGVGDKLGGAEVIFLDEEFYSEL